MLSNGDVRDDAGPQGDPVTNQQSVSLNGGGHDGAFDVSVLAVDLNTGTHNCLMITFQFLSDEYPEYVGQTFNDGFIAELDTHSWTVGALGTFNAPDNFAFDTTTPTNQPVTVNNAFMAALYGQGSRYDGATPMLTARTPIGPGSSHTLYLSIYDAADDILDSAAYIDALVVFTVNDPATQCRTGATQAPPPSPDFDWTPVLTCVGDSIVFEDLSTAVAPATITSVDWDFGDGAPSPDYSGPPVATITHVFPTDGTYTVTLTVQDSSGMSNSVSKQVRYGGCPIAAFSCTGLGNPYLRVQFQDFSSDFDNNIVSWTWDFGDGNGGTGNMPAHDYDAPGIYTVTLTVMDADGRTSTASADCEARLNRPPVIDPIPVHIVIEGDTVSFLVTASDPDNDPITLGWSPYGLPVDAKFDIPSGAFDWRTRGGDAGSYGGVIFTARDYEFADSTGALIIVLPAASTPTERATDSDADGIPDIVDNCPHLANPDQVDLDRDGVGDECQGLSASASVSTPSPGTEPSPADTVFLVDTDKDGLPDGMDNCVFTPNPGQEDLDRDGWGDACDEDIDGDGWPQVDAAGLLGDNCPYTSNPDQADADGDGVGDVCSDGDIDGDGIPDGQDPCKWSRGKTCPDVGPGAAPADVHRDSARGGSVLPWLGGIVLMLVAVLALLLIVRRARAGPA